MSGRDINDVMREEGIDVVRRLLDAGGEELPDDDDAGNDKFRLPISLMPKPKSMAAEGVSIDDFYAYMQKSHVYIFAPTSEIWPASSVNARIPPVEIGGGKAIPAATWLSSNKPVEQMTWMPGKPAIIQDRLIATGGFIERKGVRVFNQYIPPTLTHGNPDMAEPWIDHVRRVYPDDADHLIKWLAHRVQRPDEKVNHALVLGGKQGIGKDTLIEPVKRAVGSWNFHEVSPQQMLGRFNGFLKSVILRISEARDLGEFDRFKFYDHMKTYTAARRTCCVSTRSTSGNTQFRTSAA
jgi:hypothetical protein